MASRREQERIGRLPPEVKVRMAIEMTEACVRICAAGIRASNPELTDEEVKEKLRERFDWAKRKR